MKKIISLITISILLILSVCSSSFAVQPNLEPTVGSLKITKYEKGATGSENQNTPLGGVTFDIYKVADDETSTTIPTDSAILATKQSKTTGSNGVALFSNLALGRYLVVEASAPANVIEKISNFLVDIPQTTANGTALNYDVEVFPKNNTAYGTVVLTKYGKTGNDNSSITTLSGVTFILQKQQGSTWSAYPDETNAILTTNTQGKITVTGLPVGSYRFMETGLGSNNGYVLDNLTEYKFNVTLENDNTTKVEPATINVTNYKPTIRKEITSITRNSNTNNSVEDKDNLDEASVANGDIIKYTISADVPSVIDKMPTYIITERIEQGLTPNENSIVATNEYLTKNTDYTVTLENNVITVTLTESGKTKLKENNATTIDITYEATINGNADITSTGNTTTAKLTYSTIVENDNITDETVDTNEIPKTIYTGGLQIEKHENSKTGAVLSGAEFKIADSVQNAKDGKYIKETDGNDILLVTGENGKVSYKGLSYGTYYLVETKAPTYTENEETKSYNLLSSPIKITVSAGSYSEADEIIYVINRKPTILPFTGATGTATILIIGILFVVLGRFFYKKEKNI